MELENPRLDTSKVSLLPIPGMDQHLGIKSEKLPQDGVVVVFDVGSIQFAWKDKRNLNCGSGLDYRNKIIPKICQL